MDFFRYTSFGAALLLTSIAACSVCSAQSQTPTQKTVATNTETSQLLAQLQKTKRIGDVALSPDGNMLAMELAGKLTVQPVGGASTQSHVIPLCAKGKARVSSLSWSSDNQHLAVLADCDSKPEVFVTEAGSGANVSVAAKPKPLATLDGYAKSLRYAPDGKTLGLLYVKGDMRPSGALAAEKQPAGVIGGEEAEVQRVATIDAASGQLQQVSPPHLHVYDFSFSPDSKQVAYVAAKPPGQNNWWIAKLYTQPVNAGTSPKVILDPNTVSGSLHGLQIAVPRWSPDGKKIALIGGLMSDQGATGGDLYEVSSNGDDLTDLTPDAKTTFNWIDWLPNGKLIATEFVGGSDRIDELDLGAGSGNAKAGATTDHVLAQKLPYSIGDGRLWGSFQLSRDGKTAAWQASSYSTPPEVFAGPLSTTPLPQITKLNAGEKPTWGKAESIDWTNEGFHVQGWLLYPANYVASKKYGLIVMVHGGPSAAVTPRWPSAGFGPAPLAASGYFVLQPNPRGSFGQGEAFTEANRKDFGYGDLRDILAGVDAVEKQIPSVDDAKLGVTGWSYGGFMTMFSITQTHRFKAAVAGAGLSDWLSYYGENSIDQWMIPFFGASVYKDPAVYAKSSAIRFVQNVTTPTLMVVGAEDGECPMPQSFEFWHGLKAFHVPTELVVYPDEGHGFAKPADRRNVLERQIAWFNKYLQ